MAGSKDAHMGTAQGMQAPLRCSQLQLAQGDTPPGAVSKQHHLFHPVVRLQGLDPRLPGVAPGPLGHKSPMGPWQHQGPPPL